MCRPDRVDAVARQEVVWPRKSGKSAVYVVKLDGYMSGVAAVGFWVLKPVWNCIHGAMCCGRLLWFLKTLYMDFLLKDCLGVSIYVRHNQASREAHSMLYLVV